MLDQPISPEAGRSGTRERLWGLIGGALGALFGGGSALIAVYVEGAGWTESPYPAFFAKRQLLTYDLYLLAWLVVGMGFLGAALFLGRRGAYPRTDAVGATLIGMILSALSAAILFTRLCVVIRGG